MRATAIAYGVAGVLWCVVLAIRTRTTPALAALVAAGQPTEPAESLLGAAIGGLFAAYALTTGLALVALGVVGRRRVPCVTSRSAALIAVFGALAVLWFLRAGDIVPAVLYLPTSLLGIGVLGGARERPARFWLRTAAWTVRVSGLLAAVGIAFLAAMYLSFALGATSTGQVLGRINDTLVLVSYLLATPSVLALAAIARRPAAARELDRGRPRPRGDRGDRDPPGAAHHRRSDLRAADRAGVRGPARARRLVRRRRPPGLEDRRLPAWWPDGPRGCDVCRLPDLGDLDRPPLSGALERSSSSRPLPSPRSSSCTNSPSMSTSCAPSPGWVARSTRSCSRSVWCARPTRATCRTGIPPRVPGDARLHPGVRPVVRRRRLHDDAALGVPADVGLDRDRAVAGLLVDGGALYRAAGQGHRRPLRHGRPGVDRLAVPCSIGSSWWPGWNWSCSWSPSR